MMLDPIPELSSDLEWMLQSGQASNAMLAEALIEEYYVPVYRLALGLFNDPEVAYVTTQETFISSLLNVYRYRHEDGIRTWLFRIFFDVYRRISKRIQPNREQGLTQSQDAAFTAGSTHPEARSDIVLWRGFNTFRQNTRKIILLRYLLGWEIPEISSVLRTGENTVRSQLKYARREFLLSEFLHGVKSAPEKDGVSDADIEAESLDRNLSRSLGMHFPSPEFSRQELDREIESVLGRVSVLGARRRSFTSFKELLWIGLAVFLVVGVIWGVNNLLPDEPVSQAAPVANAGRTKLTNTLSPTPLVVTRQAIQPPTQEPLPTPVPVDVFYTVQPGDTLELIAANMGVSVKQLLSFNRIASEGEVHEGTRLVILSSFPTALPVKATPVSPLPQPEPLSTPASSNEIIQFIRRRSANQSTIWVDAQVIHYGPEGYVGPPIVSRNQLWMSDTQFLALHGPTDGPPQDVYLRKGGDLYLAKPGVDIPWFFPVRGNVPAESSAAADLNLMFNTLFASFPLRGSISLRVVGSDTVAGRNTWLVEKTSRDAEVENLFWVDTRTGFILRSQEFGGHNQSTVLQEVVVTAIAYDVDFPQSDLFNADLPWRGGFASDYSGKPEPVSRVQPTWEVPMGHEPLPYMPALGQFDPSHSSLTFQYPPNFTSTEPQAMVSLFAGGFYMGKVRFGNPWTMICDRSPDGSKIAYVSQPTKSVPQDAFLYWFSLLDPKEVLKRPLGDIYVTQFAFAPDSRRIAAFGYSDQFATGAIYIIDIQSGDVRPIHHQGDVKSLVWSPDGEALAFIGRNAPPQFDDEIMVIRVNTGEVTYHHSVDVESNSGSSWPPLEWGVDFPVEMGGMEACIAPLDEQ